MSGATSGRAGAAERSGPGRAIPGVRPSGLCLIVHDDLDLRLRLAALVRRAAPALDADSVDRTAFAAMSVERINTYVAVLLIIEFSPPLGGPDPLAYVARLRDSAPRMPMLIFARGGDERSAARSMKLGAIDYWPIHSVRVDELGQSLQPLVEQARRTDPAVAMPAAPIAAAPMPATLTSGAPMPAVPTPVAPKPVDRWRQPEIAGYRLLKKMAQSAGATVYLAQNNELAQPVALKVQALKGLRIGSEADRQRFARECEILSALNHRSIADVLDFGITDEYLYLALEYFPCGSLRERMRNPVSEADAFNYARQMAEALQIVHAAHVVHCDLKPSNVMLTDDNRVVLIDFGSARSQLVARDPSRSDLSTGTPYYVCPEQVAGAEPDGRGDLYSLGIILFEMLAGKVPFEGKSLAEIFTAHQSAEVPRLPKPLTRHQPFIDRLLAKSPGDRYESALAFVNAAKSMGALDR